jgi:hypothetical protein
MVSYSKSSLLKELGDAQALIQQREQIVKDKTDRITELKVRLLGVKDDAQERRDLKAQVGILWGQVKRENQYIDTLKDNVEDIQLQLEEMGVTVSRKSKAKRSAVKRGNIANLDATIKRVVGINRLQF